MIQSVILSTLINLDAITCIIAHKLSFYIKKEHLETLEIFLQI